MGWPQRHNVTKTEQKQTLFFPATSHPQIEAADRRRFPRILFLPFVPWSLRGSTFLSGLTLHWLTVTLNDTVLALAGARLPVKVHLMAPDAPTPGEVTAIAETLLGKAPWPALEKVVNAGV